MNKKLIDCSRQLGKLLLAKELYLATTESCTGGLVASAVTAIPGSSQWFERGFVTYSNASKQEMLGVKATSLNRWGAVSEIVAQEMTDGALQHSHAQVSLSITGIAGPTGGSADKPVGTVWFGWAGVRNGIITTCKHFQGGRQEVQQQAALYALKELISMLTQQDCASY